MCSLEKVTNVLVGLQMPEGGRVQANFPANTSLWDVLLHFEVQSEGKLNLTKRVAGDQKYLLPAVTYLQREVRQTFSAAHYFLEMLFVC